MKTKALLIPVIGIVVSAMTFTACNQKVDEKTMAEVTQFGTDWAAMGDRAAAWSVQLTETATQAKEWASKQTEMMNGITIWKDEGMKMKMQENVKTAVDNSTHLDGMVNDWNGFKNTWDANTSAWMEWQTKVTKGEISPGDVVTGLADWKTKMTEAQQKVEGWNTAYVVVKESCDKTMAVSDEMTKSMISTNMPEGKVKK